MWLRQERYEVHTQFWSGNILENVRLKDREHGMKFKMVFGAIHCDDGSWMELARNC
jgi:hypothetical protein